MKYAIIAAGEGSRLAQEGVELPKPLVQVYGESLIGRLIRIFTDNGATEILVICNSSAPPVSRYLADIQDNGLNGHPVPLRFKAMSTPSSMHSFHELGIYMTGDEPFVLTTVDTVFCEDEFAAYVKAFCKCVDNGYDGLMAVTGYVDDEKPLYIGTDDDWNITGFHDAENDCRFVSGGIYGLTPVAIKTLEKCISRGESRMRNFQRALVRDGLKLKAYPFGKILDVDHASDIVKAEEFLKR